MMRKYFRFFSHIFRLDCLGIAFQCSVLLLLMGIAGCNNKAPQAVSSPSQLVNPFIGTGGHGHTYPGATVPFGMVQLSPDTRLEGWDGCSAYHYSDSVVYGFSHTHLSGTGIPDYGDILLMPTVGSPQIKKGSAEDPESGYCSRFSHETEVAHPGFYQVQLEDYDIGVELTTTLRAGFHRYTFPENADANVILDLVHRDKVLESGLTIINDSTVSGYRISDAWARDQRVYFAMIFSQKFSDYQIAEEDEFTEKKESVEGTSIKAAFQFDTQKSTKLLVKVGISAVSVKNALENVHAEIPQWDFEATQAAALASWDKALGKIEIEGGTNSQQTIFYTALYHSLLNPNTFMDINGEHRDMKGETQQVDPSATTHYTIFSLWDTYRASHPLFTLIERERTLEFIHTFLRQYKAGGKLPIWELAGNYTSCMIGYHAIPVIADAYAKGLRDFDAELALEAMQHSAELNELGLEPYRELGYIPADKEAESVSKTLEYAYDDWCIAMMAKEMGKLDIYEKYTKRAQAYKNLFNPESGCFRGRINGGTRYSMSSS